MEKPVYRALILLMLLFCMVFPLNAEQLMFETSTGTLTDLSLGNYDQPNTPSAYINSTQYYDFPGFVGRLVYQGDGNTLYFDRGSLIAKNTTNNRFYYTRVNTNGSADLNRWREVFLVVRVKGLYHNGNQHDFIGYNYVVEHPGDSIPVIGAGSQTVAAGVAGYNASGASGINNTANSYPYKYQHAYLWLDVIVIRTSNARNMNNGSYETQLVISGNGVASFLNLSGYRNSENGDTPESYYFGVERAAPEYIPFSDLISKTSYTNSYLVGYLSFHSISETGTVRFASNSTGTAANFRFSATIDAIQRSFPYYVVFDTTLPNGNPTRITSAYTGFNTGSSYVPTVIGGEENWEQVLKGEIRIYVDSGLQVYSYPANTGTGSAYTSTIYCLLTIN